MKKSLVVSCVAVVLALAAALLLKICVFADFNGVKAVRVNIPRYCDNAGVDSCLRAELGNDFGGKVSRLFRISGADPGKANGSYVVEPGMTALRVAQNLRKKRQTPVRFTFNNIRTLSQLAERAGMVMEFTPDEFLEAYLLKDQQDNDTVGVWPRGAGAPSLIPQSKSNQDQPFPGL